MAKFADLTGREWVITLLVTDLTRVKATLGVDLVAVVSTAEQLGTLLFAHPEKLVAALYDVCRCEKAGVSPEQFAEGLDADALERAGYALLESGLSYTPLRKRAGQVVASLREKLAAAGEAATPEPAPAATPPEVYTG